MGGGLMQLVAYGAQDIYLTGNPQITFFKVVYRRHTNFSMESIKQTFNGNVEFGGDVSATISRNGDLVHKMYLEFNPQQLIPSGESPFSTHELACAANLGNALIKECELEIGGQRIDKHYGHWLTTWGELTESNSSGSMGKVGGNDGDSGDGENSGKEPDTLSTLYQRMTYNHKGEDLYPDSYHNQNAPDKAFLPLQFWFCRNPGLALPLIALQYHEVKVKITFPNSSELREPESTANAVNVRYSGLSSVDLYVDYIYLDTDERRRFAQVSHEYLIEQLQFQNFSSDNTTLDLNFNHPVKELIFTGTPSVVVPVAGGTDGVTTGPSTPTVLATGNYQLKLNGHDRFAERDVRYFTRTQVWQHHTGYGGTTVKDSIGVYSFALKPEEHQPSGTCNFSRIDNAQLKVDTNNNGINLYAVNYNVLRIMSGMGGLAYSN